MISWTSTAVLVVLIMSWQECQVHGGVQPFLYTVRYDKFLLCAVCVHEDVKLAGWKEGSCRSKIPQPELCFH